jgi:hypothetical protein
MGIFRTATKLCDARHTVARWRQHHAAGTVPSHLTKKQPTVQLSREFASSPEAAAARQALAEHAKASEVQALDDAIRCKADEVTFLEGALQPDKLFNELLAVIRPQRATILARSKVPNFTSNPETGEVALTGWGDNQAMIEVAQAVMLDCISWANRLISIAEARAFSKERKASAKKEIHAAADVEMADLPQAGPSMQSLIDKAVSARLKKLPKVSSPVTHKYAYLNHAIDFYHAEEVLQTWEEADEGEHAPIRASSRPHRQTNLSGHQDEDGYRHRPRQARRQGTEAAGQGQRETLGAGSAEMSKSFIFGAPWTIPDHVLCWSLPRGIDFIILNTPVDILLAAQFKNVVHRSPGVNLPDSIAQMLSVGQNYLFYQPIRASLIQDAWKDFKRRLRWRIKFLFEGHTDDSYKPEYRVVNKPSDKQPPVLPLYIEMGLKRGDSYVFNVMSHIPPSTEGARPYKPLAPSPASIRSFLHDNDYVVTTTDKNLGVAVSQRSWLKGLAGTLINEDSNYKALNPLEANRRLRKKCTEMEELAELSEFMPYLGSNLPEFLRANITPLGDHHNIPRFYVIPKIHKNPVGARPIVPCHSAIQNPAAKYISLTLKPIVKSAATILHGSKDLAIKLSQIQLRTDRRWFIVSGDVVAFYPNIPILKCLDIVRKLYKEHVDLNGHGIKPEYWDNDNSRTRVEQFFEKALVVGNTDLILQFDNIAYLQTHGLAMGVADSPDLANLYGYWFERACQITSHPQVAFYGRYIDDILAIVYAETETEALEIIKKVEFDDCRITWDCAFHHTAFLDMMLYKDEYNSVQHMPYRKTQSHQERIPWISHHPLDVKRATFISEMSRMATLSSTKQHYYDAMKSVVALYIKRGYPQNLLNSWLKLNITKRWENRLRVASKSDENAETLLVLKTEFNTAWDYFSVHKLKEVLFEYWREWLDRADRGDFITNDMTFIAPSTDIDNPISGNVSSATAFEFRGEVHYVPDLRKIGILDSRMLVSRTRTRNMFDFLAMLKHSIVQKTDERLLQDEMEPPSQGPLTMVLPSGEIIDLPRIRKNEEEIEELHHKRARSPQGWAH